VSGDGINLARIVDDDEATNWASIGSPVAGKQVTVDLAGGAHRVDRVQVSAMLRPAVTGDPDAGAQGRVSALRQFRVLACAVTGASTARTLRTSARSSRARRTRSPRSHRGLVRRS
jgi:extracellular elastinolytic metalloproteinase